MSRRKILINTDFTSISENALEYGIDLAKKIEGDIILFHSSIVPDTDPLSPAYATHQSLGQPELAYQNLVSENMRDLQNRVVERGGNNINCEYITEAGNPVGDLISVAKEHNIDYVVVGMVNEAKDEDKILLSNILRIIDEADCPVLVVPENYKFTNIERILFATDDFRSNELTMNEIGKLARPFNAELVMLHVQEKNEDLKFDEETASIKKGLEYERTSFVNVQNDDVVNGLKAYINKNKTELLVMHKHKRNFIERIFKDSLTEQMASSTRVPLLVYHDK